MKRLLLSGCASIIRLTISISSGVTDRLRYVMIVSIPETIKHQKLERKLFLKKTYGKVLNLKLKAIIARERIPKLDDKAKIETEGRLITPGGFYYLFGERFLNYAKNRIDQSNKIYLPFEVYITTSNKQKYIVKNKLLCVIKNDIIEIHSQTVNIVQAEW